MPYTGELIAIVTVLCWTVSVQFFEAAAKRVGSTPVNIIRLTTAKGFHASSHSTISNHKCEYESIEQERLIRNEVVAETIRIFRANLPVLLKRLSKIQVSRSPKKIKHKLTSLMI